MSSRFTGGVSRAVRWVGTSLAVVALGALLTAAVLEIWARSQPRRWFMIFDETLGFRLEPGASGEYRGLWMLGGGNPAIRSAVRINSLGMHGPERTVEKPPGTRRLLLLGDSYVQSFEVPWEQTFYAQLEDRAREAGTHLETLPMGVNGYGQAQELLAFQRDGLKLRPDLVMLVVFLGNDIEDNSQDLGAGTARPYFDLIDGKLVQVATPDEAAHWKYWISGYVRSFLMYREIALRFDVLKQAARKMGWINFPEGAEGAQHGERLAERRDKAWNLTTALIQEIARVAHGADARFLLAFHGSYPLWSMEFHDRMAKFCGDAQLDCLDLAAELEGHKEFFVPEDEHWTPRGHQHVAELMWARWQELFVGNPAS